MKTEGERIVKVETELNNVSKNVDEIKNEIRSLQVDIRTFIASADERYSSKKEMAEIKAIATTRVWQASLLSGLLMTMITFFVTQYFSGK